MAEPAASSRAEVIRFPDESRAIDVSMSRWTLSRLLRAFIAATLVLITDIFYLNYYNFIVNLE
jgi:hypothetical protein